MKAKLRICMVNWRCPRHTRAGGAEVSTLETLKRLAQQGHQITWFSSKAKGAPDNDFSDGITYIRMGNQVSVRLYFIAWALLNQSHYDLVIEQVNTLPFLCRLYLRVPVICYVHQVAKELWFYQVPRWAAPIGYALEAALLFSIRKTPAIVVSRSTLLSLSEYGHKAEKWIVPNGRNEILFDPTIPVNATVRTRDLIIVGRIVPHKRISHAIEATAILRHRSFDVRLHIVGDYHNREGETLQQLANSLGISDHIVFHGRLTDHELASLYKGSYALLSTSVREGWGLTITEANSQGVPSVVYPSPGLVDSTVHGCNGIICSGQSPKHLADGIITLMTNYRPILFNLHTFWPELTKSWDESAELFATTISRYLAPKH